MKDAKVAAFLLEQELPPQPTVSTSSTSTTTINPKSSKPKDNHSRVVVDHVTQVGLEACCCTHLQEYLPHILNSELCRTVDNRWIIANPIHSLHLASQMDDVQHANSWKQPPLLFGDEEQRTTVLKSQGIAEVWSPLDGYSSALQDDNFVRRESSIPPSRLSGILAATTPSLLMMPQLTPPSASSSSFSQFVSGTTTPPLSSSPADMTPATMPMDTNATATVPAMFSSIPESDPTVATGIVAPSSIIMSGNAGEKDDMDVDTTTKFTPPADAPPAAATTDPTTITITTTTSSSTTNSTIPDTEGASAKPVLGTDPKVPVFAPHVANGGAPMAATNTDPSVSTVPPKAILTNEEESSPTPFKAAEDTGVPSTTTEETTTAAEQGVVSTTTHNKAKEETKTEGALAVPTETETKSSTVPVSEETKTEVEGVKSNNNDDTPASVPTKEDSVAPIISVEANTSEDPTTPPKSKEDNSEDVAPSAASEASEDGLAPVTSTETKRVENKNVSEPQESKGDEAVVIAPASSESNGNSKNPSSSPQAQSSDTAASTSAPVENVENVNPTASPPSEGTSMDATTGAPDAATNPVEPTSSEPSAMAVDAPAAAATAARETMKVDPITSKPPDVAPPVAPSPPPQPHELADEHYHQLKLAENTVRMIRRSIVTYGRVSNKKKSENAKKKRKKDNDFFKSTPVPGWIAPPPKDFNTWQEEEWKGAREEGPKTVERWMEQFRLCRESYYDEQRITQKATAKGNIKKTKKSFYLAPDDLVDSIRCCTVCAARTKRDAAQSENLTKKLKRRVLMGDELMQCLECAFIGCAPKSIAPDSHQHILQHLLVSGHKFAITCGERARLFCFCCGDFVYHKVFEQEKLRLDYARHLANLSWREHRVQRSFDPFQFMLTEDHGIVWRGPIATYPALVPNEHFSGTQLTSRRKAIFEGNVQENWLMTKPNATVLAASQRLLDEAQRFHISAPVGMYNLGNTCFKSAILQCLIHCKPLQQYFLKEAGHHHKSCQLYRNKMAEKNENENGSSVLEDGSPKSEKIDPECLACEMDRLFLSYYGSTIGRDVFVAIEESSRHLFNEKVRGDDMDISDPIELEQGEALIISEMLTATWKSGGMNHLAGYEQRDAHEFLNSFLELMGKNTKQHRDRVVASINTARDNNGTGPERGNAESDIVKRLFQGTLRSVFLCEECGEKRMLHEPFMNISLTLSEKAERIESDNNASGDNSTKLSVQTCLEHFIVPEKLGDPIDCPHCERRTTTKKQHTFSKLPKVLCLHLKRFDAARNRKIDESVSFPAHGLNMGPLLSHWCEVSNVPSSYETNGASAEPSVLYDLFGTVNHIGNMQSGHYVTNVKVKDQWYHCNDEHISLAGTGNGEEAVLNNGGAYILFYIRR